VPGDRLRAQRPDHAWAFDFQFDVTDDGRAVKLLYVVDEFTREALAMVAERRIDGDRVVDGAGTGSCASAEATAPSAFAPLLS
jgi:hypothetical protein